MYVCMYVCMYVYICICVYIACICIYVRTQIYPCDYREPSLGVAWLHYSCTVILGNPVSHHCPTSCSAAKPEFARCVSTQKKGKFRYVVLQLNCHDNNPIATL